MLDPNRRLRGHSGADRPVVDPAHGHRRVGDGRLDLAELHHLQGAGHLAGAVRDRDAGRHRLTPQGLGRPGGDRGHAGPRHTAPGGRVGLVAHDGDVTHAHAGDVRDRVRGAGLEPADADAVLARAAGHARDPIPRDRQPVIGGACAGNTSTVARDRWVLILVPQTVAVTVTRRASLTPSARTPAGSGATGSPLVGRSASIACPLRRRAPPQFRDREPLGHPDADAGVVRGPAVGVDLRDDVHGLCPG